MSKKSTSSRFSLSNQFLVAMPGLVDPNFHQTVSYICEHNEGGAMGLVINRPLDMSFADLCQQLDIEITDNEAMHIPIFHGGPVEHQRGFILHTPLGEWDTTLAVTPEIGLTMSQDIIQAIAEGYDADSTPPEQFLIALGYAGWSEDQLEYEMAENVWLNVPASQGILFNTPVEHRWTTAAASLGIDLQQLSTDIGHG